MNLGAGVFVGVTPGVCAAFISTGAAVLVCVAVALGLGAQPQSGASKMIRIKNEYLISLLFPFGPPGCTRRFMDDYSPTSIPINVDSNHMIPFYMHFVQSLMAIDILK
jgi:hypothetical protein